LHGERGGGTNWREVSGSFESSPEGGIKVTLGRELFPRFLKESGLRKETFKKKVTSSF